MDRTGVDRSVPPQGQASAKLDAVGWGVFMIWVGAALLADVGWPVFFLGTGLIMLGAQLARRYLALRTDWFGVTLGVVFVVAGGMRALDLHWDKALPPAWLLPSVFIAAGLAIIVSAWRRGPNR